MRPARMLTAGDLASSRPSEADRKTAAELVAHIRTRDGAAAELCRLAVE